jgi:hypothetical protein
LRFQRELWVIVERKWLDAGLTLTDPGHTAPQQKIERMVSYFSYRRIRLRSDLIKVMSRSEQQDRGKVMRGIAFGCAVIGIFAAAPSYACNKPQAPSCAIEGAFASARDQDQCRRRMLDYNGGMEDFAQCLRDEGRDEQPALKELEYTLSEFNRRSRELPNKDDL